jgi:hypothetical protein
VVLTQRAIPASLDSPSCQSQAFLCAELFNTRFVAFYATGLTTCRGDRIFLLFVWPRLLMTGNAPGEIDQEFLPLIRVPWAFGEVSHSQ